MARIVVTYGTEANLWAQQFCRRAAWARGVSASEARGMLVVPSVTRASIVTAMGNAARQAGGGGEVIYSIGHGNGNLVGANAQLGTSHDFTVTQRILSADADGWITRLSPHCIDRDPLSPGDQLVNRAFRQIGESLCRDGVRRLSFLTCVLGNNAAFLRSMKVALGGSIEVAGYKGYVCTSTSTNQVTTGQASNRIRLFLANDAQGTRIMPGSDTEPFCLLESPEAQFVTVV